MPPCISKTPPARGVPVLLCRMILPLLPLAVVHGASMASLPPVSASQPYLTADASNVRLRFRAEVKVAALVRKTTVSGPPVAAAPSVEVAAVALANNQAAASTPTPPIVLPPMKEEPSHPAETSVKETLPKAEKALPILPDDTPRKVQSQDFLPLFRFPGNTHEDVVFPSVATPPVPGTLPPSSATYHQQ